METLIPHAIQIRQIDSKHVTTTRILDLRRWLGIPPWIATSDTGVRTVEHESPGSFGPGEAYTARNVRDFGYGTSSLCVVEIR